MKLLAAFGSLLLLIISLVQPSALIALEEGSSTLFMAPEEARYHIEEMQSRVSATLQAILSIPFEEQTEENTIMPWDALCENLCTDIQRWRDVAHSDAVLDPAIVESLEAFHCFMLESTHAVALLAPGLTPLSEAFMAVWLRHLLASAEVSLLGVEPSHVIVFRGKGAFLFSETEESSLSVLSEKFLNVLEKQSGNYFKVFFSRNSFSEGDSCDFEIMFIDRKSDDASNRNTRDTEYKVEAGVRGTFGGEIKPYIEGEVKDKNGNYAKGSVEKDKNEYNYDFKAGSDSKKKNE